MAESVIGILKGEADLDQTFTNVAHAKRAANNAINLYNETRIHFHLYYKTPIWHVNYQRKMHFNH